MLMTHPAPGGILRCPLNNLNFNDLWRKCFLAVQSQLQTNRFRLHAAKVTAN